MELIFKVYNSKRYGMSESKGLINFATDITNKRVRNYPNEKQQKKTKEITVPVYMMNRELSWLKFNERVLNEAGNPRVPLAERLTFAAIYQSNLDEFYRVRVGTLMDQMEASEVIRENKTNMTSEEQVTAIIQATRDLDQKKAAIYEQLMGELEPYGVRLINFNRLSAEEGKLLETYFDQEIAPYLSANIVSKQQPFPFLKNKNIYAVASLMSKGGKTKTAIIPCSNTVFRRLIDIPTRKGTFMLSEELILHFLPKMFKSYEIRRKRCSVLPEMQILIQKPFMMRIWITGMQWRI